MKEYRPTRESASPSRGEADETDARLIQQATSYLQGRGEAAGDATSRAAWDDFYAIYGQIIPRFVRACGVPEGDVPDCVQDVWTAVLAELPKLEYHPHRGRFRSWMYAIVRNKATDLVRRKMRGPTTISTLHDAVSLHDTDPKEIWEQRWTQEAIHAVLEQFQSKVSDLTFRVFHMRSIEERDVADVAVAVGLTRDQVRARHHRAHVQFAELFKSLTGEDFQDPAAGAGVSRPD